MLDSIALAFQSCPKLSNLIIECYGQHVSGMGTDERQNRFYHDIHPAPVNKPSSWHKWRLDSMQLNIWDILKPIHNANRALDSLVLLDVHIGCPRSWIMPTTEIFRSLKHLRHLGSSSNFLHQIVARAPELESIGILGSPYSRDVCSLQSLFGNSVPQHLRACSLNRLALVEADLVTFLLRHSSTLQDLRIVKETWPSTMSWASFARRVQGRLPNLRRVDVSDLKCSRIQQWPNVWVAVPAITRDDLLQNHAYDLETGPMEVMDGLWEEYEKLFFPGEYK